MKEQSASSGNTQKTLFIVGGLILIALLITILWLTSSQKKQSQAYEATFTAITAQAEQQAAANLETPVQEASATPTLAAIEDTATPTSLPPTATDVPVLGLTEDGLQVRCLTTAYDLPINSSQAFYSGEDLVREGSISGTTMDVTIPVRACAVFVTFTQPLNGEVTLDVYQGKDANPWYSRTFLPADQMDHTYYAVLDHSYLVNPPYWNLSYPLKIRDAGQVYWQGDLVVSRTFNGLCWEGSMPDPVTLKCPAADKLEREPHPDMPTMVPDGLPK